MSIDGDRVEALYRELGPAIYRRCLKLLRNPADAEEATQEVFVRVYKHLASLTTPSALPWAYQIATRVCLNRIRGARREAVAMSRADAATPPANLAEALADRHLASAILSRFDERTGLIAVYHLVDGMTQDEVAELVGVSRKTVGNKLREFFESASTFLGAA